LSRLQIEYEVFRIDIPVPSALTHSRPAAHRSKLAPVSQQADLLLENLKIFNTHYLVVILPEASPRRFIGALQEMGEPVR
jgi:hypothetical protein